MHGKLRSLVLVLTIVGFWTGTARATDDSVKGAARALANEAKRDFDAGRFEEAERKFQRAYEVAKVPTLALWAARSLAKHGQLVAASELYRQATRLTANDLWVGNAQQQAQADAAKELGELQPRIPALRVRVEGAAANDVTLTIDGAMIASALVGLELPADPGWRRVVGKRGDESSEQTVYLNEGDHKEAVLKFTARPPMAVAPMAQPVPTAGAEGPGAATLTTSTAAPAEAPSSGGAQQTWGWIAVSVGAAGLIMGGVTGIVVLSDSSLRNSCKNGCPPTVSKSKVDTYNLMRNLSTVGLIVGGVGAAVGVTLLLWTPKHETDSRAALWLGPGSVALKGTF
ncbi:MAG TPA: hypothetical protein VJ860_14140 [Polyangia bacterium]|jgi:hypothetical protein|nr:hypothetical protein [Polyangia bacterium]